MPSKTLTSVLDVTFVSMLVFWLCYFHRSFAKRLVRFIAWGIVIVCVLAAAGYLSNTFSRTACEGIVVEKIFKDVRSRDVFIHHDSDQALANILSRFGFKVARCSAGQFRYPLVLIYPPSRKVPFILSIQWGWATALENDEGRTTQFLCLFGWAIPIKERLDWIS
jgi:hypothetical protein